MILNATVNNNNESRLSVAGIYCQLLCESNVLQQLRWTVIQVCVDSK